MRWGVPGWVLVVVALGCEAAPVPSSLAEAPEVAGVREIDARTLAVWIASGRAPYVVDVRTAEEFSSGHIPGAHHVPIDRLRAATDALPRGEPVFVICEGGVRSKAAAQSLAREGFEVADVRDGMAGWRWGGHPVAR
jgi:thioredoxin 1